MDRQVSFQWKNLDFLLENPDFLLENVDFLLKNPDFLLKNLDCFNKTGDWASNGSMDAVCQAMSGSAVAQGGGPSHPPILQENCPADQSGAWNFAFGIVSALYAREKTGQFSMEES